MNPADFDDALILTGPTASGKSAVGLILADRLGAEIVAMDSMTLYRGMDVGTAKPSRADRQRVPHHLIDVLDPWEPASLAWWLDQAARVCKAIGERGRRVLFVGGTPLYLKGLLRGIFRGPAADAALRAKYEASPLEELVASLRQVDPSAATRIHPHDRRRLVRALEVWRLTGRPISEQQREFAKPRPRCHPPIWLDPPRAVLHDRINRRVDLMIANGLLDEVRGLLALSHPLGKEARQALGYKEIIDHLMRHRDWLATVELIKTRSRQFAKRQVTWFRHLEECRRWPITDAQDPEDIAEGILATWKAAPDMPKP